jgi:hypothetical protein
VCLSRVRTTPSTSQAVTPIEAEIGTRIKGSHRTTCVLSDYDRDDIDKWIDLLYSVLCCTRRRVHAVTIEALRRGPHRDTRGVKCAVDIQVLAEVKYVR